MSLSKQLVVSFLIFAIVIPAAGYFLSFVASSVFPVLLKFMQGEF